MKKILELVSALVLFFLMITPFVATAQHVPSADVLENSWISRAQMHEARSKLGLAVVNDKIYAIGGSTSNREPAGTFVGTNEEYDPATNIWTMKASMPTPRADFAIATYQNKIYCIGGAVGVKIVDESDYPVPLGFKYTITSKLNEVYDTARDTWTTKSPMPKATMKFQAHMVNGKIYAIGTTFTYVYDPDDDSWINKTRMPQLQPASSLVSAVVGNKIIFTGEFRIGWNYASAQKVIIYDTETDSWKEGGAGPTVISAGAAGATTGMKAPARVYVLGLALEQYPYPSVNRVYNPKTDTWATAGAMPTNRSDFGVAVVNDILYVIGGYVRLPRSLTLTNLNEQYVPIGYSNPPEIKIQSPVNQLYNASSISLIFTIDKPISWAGYSLDGKENVTIMGNTTITGLSNDLHNVTVYVKDPLENIGGSETVIFSTSESFPTASVAAASIASIAVAGIGLLFYFKKRKSHSFSS